MRTSLEALHPFSFSSSQPVIVSTSWFQCLPPSTLSFSSFQLLSPSFCHRLISSSHLFNISPFLILSCHRRLSLPALQVVTVLPFRILIFLHPFSFLSSQIPGFATAQPLDFSPSFSVRRSFRRLSGQKFVPLSGRPFQIAFNSPHKVRKFASYLAALALS